jgi:O-antigen ligase
MASTSDPRALDTFGGGASGRRFPPVTVFVILAILVLNGITLGGMALYGPAVLLAPVLVLGLAFGALRFLSDPVQVLCWFLVIIVNLDFVRIHGTRLTADILTSSMLLYAMMLRFGLAGTFAVRGPVPRTYLLFLGVTFISVLLSVDRPASVKNWGRDLEYWLLFLFVSSLALSDRDRLRIARATVVSTVIPCLCGLAGMAFNIDAFYGMETPVEGGPWVKRITGTLAHPVVFSEYLAFTATITLALLIFDKTCRKALFPVLLLELIVLYLTYGRTGWIEFVAAIIALFWFMGRRKIVFTVLPVIGAGLLAAIPTLLARMQNVFDVTKESENSMVWRIGLWIYALKKFPRKPIFGSGPDTFIHYVNYGVGFAAHHTWINLLIETGIIGAGTFALVLVAAGRALSRRRRDPDAHRDPIVVGMSAAFVGVLTGSFAHDPFNLPVVCVYYWALLALALHPRSLPGTVS